MSKKRFFKLFKRGMAVALAMSLVTGLAPVNISTNKVNLKRASASSYKYYCSRCGQYLNSAGSHTYSVKTTCGGTVHISYESGNGYPNYCYDDTSMFDYKMVYHNCRRECGRCGEVETGDGWGFTLYGCTSMDEVNSKEEEFMTDTCMETVYKDQTCSGTLSNGAITSLSVTLSYNVSANGGTSSQPASIEVDPDTILSSSSSALSKTASKPGWTFVGWNTNRNAHTGLTSLTMSSNKTLYAIFKKDINTTFTDVNGTEKRVKNDSASIWNSDTVAAVTLPEQGTKDGWTSAGWSVKNEPDPSQIITSASYNISDSTDFYGIYKKTVSVNIDTDGDGVSDSTKDTDVYVNSDNQDAQQGTIQAPSSSPSKEGYDFDGWMEKDGDGTVYPPGADMTITGKGDIIPHYTPVTYKVHFNINNGTSGTMEDQTLTYDEAADLTLNTFGRTGYTFMGWSDTADGEVKYTDGKSVKNLSSVKNDTVNLYAVWKINSSGLTVAPAGGTWKHSGNSYTAPESFKQDYNTTLSIEELERTGYTFKEWIKTYDASRASGFNGKLDGNTYTFGEKDSAADTITASWTANKYTVEYYDGTTKAGEDTFTYDVSAPLRTFLSLGISKTGYDLKGWSESPSGDVKYTDGESIKNLSTVNNAVIKLYAVYEPHKYKITYNGVVGATNSNKTEYTVEDADFKLTEPVKEGFVFLGWTGEGITSPSKDVSIKTSEHKDLEYTAEWKSLISVSVPAQVQVKMSGGTTENASPVEFVNSSKSDVKVTVSSFAQTAAGDYTLIDRTADEKADWKKLSHKDRTMALYVENTKDSGFKTSGTKVYVNDSNRELGVISPGEKASPYITCHHTSSITDEETTLSMGSYTIQWTVALSQ